MGSTLPLPVVLAGACWLLLGFFYTLQMAGYSRRRYLLRVPNYRHFSHTLIAVQFAASLSGIGDMELPSTWINPARTLGLGITIVSFVLCLWARSTLGPFWDKHASIQPGHQLVHYGLYRWCRNPIFQWQMGMFLGVAIVTTNWIALACCLAALWSFWRRTRVEEVLLRRYFGLIYDEYSAAVPRFALWPRLQLQDDRKFLSPSKAPSLRGPVTP